MIPFVLGFDAAVEYGIVVLACNLSCNEQEGTAVDVGIKGTSVMPTALIIHVRRISHLSLRRKYDFVTSESIPVNQQCLCDYTEKLSPHAHVREAFGLLK